MQNKIQTIFVDELIESFEEGIERFDVFLSDDLNVFSDIQVVFDEEKTFSLVTLEEEDLHSQQSIFNGLYQVFFEELPSDEDPLEIIEALEDDIGEIQSCILVVESFSSCNEEAQASLLELVIVSKAFKLLLKVDKDFNFSQNEQLWNVLSSRCIFLNDEPSLDVESNSSQREYLDQEPNSKQDLGAEEHNISRRWHQHIPKYHLLAGFFLVLLVLGLWNMDLSQQKEEILDLSADAEEGEKLQVKNNNSVQSEVDTRDVVVEDVERVITEKDKGSKIPEAVIVEALVEDTLVKQIQIKEEKELPFKEALPKEEKSKKNVVPVVRLSSTQPSFDQVDWRPYQSNAWILGLNKKYFTLQLMASHNAQGIRNFLSERGVSSQYAVYTTQKNGKPWHVIIYGVYETHSFADLARKDLPDYLKNYSPWIRAVSDVHSSLK